jgi:hypothetical protein
MDGADILWVRVPIVTVRLLHICLMSAILLGYVSAGWANQIDMPHHRHGPPWSAPVASSQTIQVGGATIQIDFAPGDLDLPKSDVIQWIETAARAVSEYYGKFPVARARVLVVPIADERGVLTGTTWGDVDGFPAFTRMRLGQHTTEQTLTNDWTMTHEFVHTALPSLSPDHHWLEEGLATYVEPIARVQIGTLSAEQIWGAMVRDIGQGEPRPGENGLDQTQTWASTYWGGALFCLVADVSIRKKTGNQKGLQDALRGILASGGSIADDWPISKVLEAGDRATGTSVLTNLYKQMGNTPYAPIDLDQLWEQLGVQSENGKIKFDNRAPLAKIRQAITSPR